MNDDNITFDEIDLGWLLGAVVHQLKTTQWDVTDETDWSRLAALKGIEEKLRIAIEV